METVAGINPKYAMNAQLNESIEIIEGIGPKRTAYLNGKGVYTLLDLISVPTKKLLRALEGLSASEEMIRSWQNMAFLMQSDVINGQAAEALLHAGISRLSQLWRCSSSELQAAFDQAIEQNLIPEAPSSEDQVQMRIDAAILDSTYCLCVKFTSESSGALTNRPVRFGTDHTTTNSNGLARFCGLKHTHFPLQLEEPDGTILEWKHVHLDPYADNPGSMRLLAQDAVRHAPEEIFDEFLGEVPPPGAYNLPVSEHAGDADRIRVGDILKIRKRYANGRELKVQSIFNQFTHQRMHVPVFRLPLDTLEFAPEVDDYVIRRPEGFAKIEMNREKIRDWKKMKVTKAGLTPPDMTDSSDVTRYLKELIKREATS